MKCSILHESRGRLRVHLHCSRMSLHEADVLEYYLRDLGGVEDAYAEIMKRLLDHDAQ